jgi:hypothetical protein
MNAAALIQQIAASVPREQALSAIKAHFAQLLAEESFVESLPLLQNGSSSALGLGQLVRVRCMIQDSLDPDYYLETVDGTSFGHFSETLQLPEHYDMRNAQMAERDVCARCGHAGFVVANVFACVL